MNDNHFCPHTPEEIREMLSVIGVANVEEPFATAEGWLYLAGIRDLFNGEIVSYAMSERMTKDFVCKALFRAVVAKRPVAGLIHHSQPTSGCEVLKNAVSGWKLNKHEFVCY